MAVSDRELDEILDQLRHEKDTDGGQPEPERSAENGQPVQEPAPESEPVTPDAEPDAAQPAEDSTPEPAPPDTPEQNTPKQEQDTTEQEQDTTEQEPDTPEQEPSPETPEQKPAPEPLKPERSLVSVAIRRQQRRRAAGKQSAKTVPVRRQAADAAKRQRRIYDVPVLEETPQEQPEASAKPQRRTLREAAFGLALLLFALIGLFSLARTGIRSAKERSSTKNAAVTQCILPLCVVDMPSFEKPEDLTDQQFLTAAVWAFITDGRLAEYPSDTNLCTVPAAEIVKAGNLRFGTARQPECRTVGFTDALRFYYDADQDSFLLPADPRYFGNLPEVQSVTEQDGLYTVSVVCRPEQPSWYQTEAPVVRHSEFIMKQAHGTWQIAALHTDAPDAQNEEETEPTHEQEDD